MNRQRLVGLVAALCAAAAAHAHHGWSRYESGRTISLTGIIVESAYVYPHATIRLQTAERTWLAVLAPPARMAMRGVPRDRLLAGAEVTVEGYHSRAEAGVMRAERITLHGRTVELR